MSQTIYRKVSTAERLPKENNTYFTGWNTDKAINGHPVILGSNYFSNGKWELEDEHDAEPDWWLEEVKLPTDEQIEAVSRKLAPVHISRKQIERGILWLRYEILGQ